MSFRGHGFGRITWTTLSTIAFAALIVACSESESGTPPPVSTTEPAAQESSTLAQVFADPHADLSDPERQLFFEGQEAFNRVVAEADGLGPLFNADSCADCHPSTGRRQVPPEGELVDSGLVIRLSIPESDPRTGAPVPEPTYGDQLQDRAVEGVDREGTVFTNYVTQQGIFPDGTIFEILWPTVNIRQPTGGPLVEGVQFSARIGAQLVGMGYLEAIPDETILALADPTDSDGDGISGRPNIVWNPQTSQPELGRFGWKANVVELDQQVAQAFHGDLGMSSSLFPATRIEVTDEELVAITHYLRGLAVPSPRLETPQAQRGQERFHDFGCASCHVESLTTGPSEIAALSEKQIAPYTDLLLHDLGFDMGDDRPDYAANGREWRTAPLWGLGLVPIEGDRGLLHDGRARTIEEAILWHGGEGSRSRDRYMAASPDSRAELLAFLESL